MRILTKIEVSGATIDDIINAARDEWRKLLGEDSAELPEGAEISIEMRQNNGTVDYDTYVGTIHIRANR